MALKNTTILHTESGFEIPTENVIVCATHIKKAIPTHDEEGVFTGVIRVITYDLFFYKNTLELRAEIQGNPNNIQGGVKELESGWEKTMTEEEYASLLANGMIAEVCVVGATA